METSAALERLPLPYATALRLQAAGAGDDVIAAGLGIDLDELPMLLRLAHAKLRRLLADEQLPTSPETK